jgi:hypothetical protein
MIKQSELAADCRYHPIDNLCKLLLSHRPKLTLEFSKYISGGYGKTLRRVPFQVDAKDINVNWLLEQESSLEQGEELAIHSRVMYRNREFHIPMIDFIFISALDNLEKELEPAIENLRPPVRLRCYNSGRSIHGYYFFLIAAGEWHEYLGSLLLCNFTNQQQQIVDTRWVGHSLQHGYTALRWTHNSKHYKSLPRLVESDHTGSELNTAFPWTKV